MKTAIQLSAALTLSASMLSLAAVAVAPDDATKLGDTAMHHVNLVEITEDRDIIEVAVDAGDFNTLATALTASDLIKTLKGKGPFTVLAPTDAAFAKLDQAALANTLNNTDKSRLVDVLTYHVIPGKLSAAELASRRFVTTVDGQRITISTDNGLRCNDSSVIACDIQASNGVIHVIDTVLIPAKTTIVEVASEAGSFKTLLAAAEAAGLVEALSGGKNLTVFAPTDEAFAKLPRGVVEALLKRENKDALKSVLLYHVLPNRSYDTDVLASATLTTLNEESIAVARSRAGLTVSGANIVGANIEASNGVVHVIDTVMVPPSLRDSIATLTAPKIDPKIVPLTALIEVAIEQGAPLFNEDQPAACAAVYRVAIQGLLLSDKLDRATRRTLTQSLSDGMKAHGDIDRAWAYREGLDNAYQMLTRMAMNPTPDA